MVTLTQVSKTARSELVLISLGIISIILFAFILYSFIKTPADETTAQNQVAYINAILPGESTKDDVVTSLGEPLEIKTKVSKEIYLYPSTNQFLPHEVQFSQEKADLVKEQILGDEKGKLSDFTRQYSQPESILYGESHGTIAPGHFWGSRGLMVFAN